VVVQQSPQEIRQEAAQRRAETKAMRRHTLEHAVRRVFVCSNPQCQVVTDVHGSRAHEWQKRLWPCMKCGQGGDAPELRFQNPMSGIVYTEDQWREYLDGVSTNR
jgi:hypothetical protein